jgi:hypothetical protein
MCMPGMIEASADPVLVRSDAAATVRLMPAEPQPATSATSNSNAAASEPRLLNP